MYLTNAPTMSTIDQSLTNLSRTNISIQSTLSENHQLEIHLEANYTLQSNFRTSTLVILTTSVNLQMSE